MDNLGSEMMKWRLNHHIQPPSPWADVCEILMVAILCFLLYVLVVVLMATPDLYEHDMIQDEAQTSTSQGRN